MRIPSFIKSIVRMAPNSFINRARKIQLFFLIKKAAQKQKVALRKLKNKDVIKCVFLAISADAWKYDKLYRMMIEHPRFDPVILVCPIVNNGRENLKKRMDLCYDFLEKKHYNVIKSFNEDNGTYVDLKRDLVPDIIFYCNPYGGLIDNRYFITNYIDYLTVYVGYYFNETADYDLAYNQLLHNLVWRRYLETNEHQEYAKLYSFNKGRNTVVTGYPGIENLIFSTASTNSSCWKSDDSSLKRIIWAPHHTIKEAPGAIAYSCFLDIYDTMLELAIKYKDKVQFAFKPHPLLRIRLNKLWGVEKTDDYYNKWSSMSNTTYIEGDYCELFLTSDAMIHDSGSFLVEYLYVNKPVIRTLNDMPLNMLHNPFGLKCLEVYYFAKSSKDIDLFIQNVINGVDPLKEKRTDFIENVLMPKTSPSKNIIDDVIDSIDKQILYRN